MMSFVLRRQLVTGVSRCRGFARSLVADGQAAIASNVERAASKELSSSETSSDDAESPKRRKRKERLPDTPHVMRRTEYEKDMAAARKEFVVEAAGEVEARARAKMESQSASVEDSQARQQAKRAKSEAAFAKALEMRAEQKVLREENRVRGLEHWESRNAMVDKKRLDVVQALNADAVSWVTEQNLSEKVDDLLDSFFIDAEAAEFARRGAPDLLKSVKVAA